MNANCYSDKFLLSNNEIIFDKLRMSVQREFTRAAPSLMYRNSPAVYYYQGNLV